MDLQSTSDMHEWSARDVERRTVLDLDLNYPPPDECIDPSGFHGEPTQYYHFQRQTMGNPEIVDEDIAIISPRKFAEATKNFRRNHFQSRCGVPIRFSGNTEIYGGLSVNNDMSRILEQKIHNLELCLSSGSSSRTRTKATDVEIPLALAERSLPPAAPTLRCAICIEPLVEETTTKCGHIFCRSCIETAIAVQHRCPICRHKLRKRDIIRIYLPFSS